ncbi:phosphate metabolism protein 7 [Coemansia sp. RSA 1722]|nr:phosphate metabolism protein 7 [Coemansia sp. RSA 486]KAJ2237346.1 phosphate metabolism protein 7 [Coemansia sp. RSA 485]KAJ2593192.1 phosphate metabolism protein 7 [Coemansia sp. RSA 1722]
MDSSTTTSDNSPNNSVHTFLSSLFFNLAVSAGILLLFCILRPRFKRVYAPRTYAVEKEKRSEPIGNGVFSWIPAVLRVPDEDIIQRSGLDTYMFLRGIRSNLIIFAVIGVVSAATILPINILGTNGLTGLDSLSIGNVDSKSSRLWVHVGFFGLIVVWTLWNIVGELRIYTHLRMWWLTHPNHATRAQASTVLVTDLPKTLVNNEERLFRMFDTLPGGVRQIFVNRSSEELADTVKKRDRLAAKLEKLLTKYAVKCIKTYEKASLRGDMYVQPQRPVMRKGPLSVVGSKVETFEYLAAEIAMCNHYIAQNLKQMQDFKREPSALVMFNKQVAAHMASQVVLDYKPFSMGNVTADVNPEDIIWSNLKISPWSRRIRGYVSFGITLALTFLWTILTAFISGLIQVDKLTQLEAFKWLTTNKYALGIFSGIVPSLVLALMMTLLPHILRLLLRLEGTPRFSLIDLRLLHRMFFFQVWNVYLVNILSSSSLVIVTSSLSDPTSIFTRLQEDVPKSAINILTYVLLLTFIGAGKEIIQGVSLAMRYLMPLLFAKTPRKIASAEKPTEFNWGATIPTHTLVFLFGFSYTFIAPYVSWFVALYYAIFYIIYRYQFLYVYNDSKWVTGGLSYPKSIKQILVGIYISEIYLVLMMLSRVHGTADSVMRVVVAVGLVLFTVAVHLYINEVYMPAINYLPLKKAFDIEQNPLLASEFPDVLGDEEVGFGDVSDASSLISLEQRKKRNWIYAMYSSLVPTLFIKQTIRAFPSILGSSTNALVSSSQTAPTMSRSQTDKYRLSMIDASPMVTAGRNELARMFSSPEIRARPVCNLWVPLGNEKLFGRLLWEIEHYGQGTILVITQGTEITEKFKVRADTDFDIEAVEVGDKAEVYHMQKQRSVSI